MKYRDTWSSNDLQLLDLTMNEKYLLPKLYREQTFNHTSTWHSINDNSGKNGVITTLAKGAEVKTYMCPDLKREHQDRGPSNDHEYELQYCVTLQYIITDLHVHFCFFHVHMFAIWSVPHSAVCHMMRSAGLRWWSTKTYNTGHRGWGTESVMTNTFGRLDSISTGWHWYVILSACSGIKHNSFTS